MNSSSRNKIAAIVITLYTLPQLVLAANWIITGGPVITDLGIDFALSLFATMLIGLMCVPGVWQDQKGYKILALIVLGINALGALPGILVAPIVMLRILAAAGVVVFIVLLMLLINRTPRTSIA